MAGNKAKVSDNVSSKCLHLNSFIFSLYALHLIFYRDDLKIDDRSISTLFSLELAQRESQEEPHTNQRNQWSLFIRKSGKYF